MLAHCTALFNNECRCAAKLFVRSGTDVLRVERDGEAPEITFSLMPTLAPDFQMSFDLTKWFHVKLKMHFSPENDSGASMQGLEKGEIGCRETLTSLHVSKGEKPFSGAIPFHLQRRAAGKIFLEVPAHYEWTDPWISGPSTLTQPAFHVDSFNVDSWL